MRRKWGSALLLNLLLSGCGGSASGGDPTSTPTPTPYAHIVGSSAQQYTEASESSNNVTGTAEATGYTLNSTGIVISGSFEASSPTWDNFSFNSGSAGYATVRAFVNGAASSADIKLQCSGYSALPIGSSASTQDKVAVIAGKTCYVIVYPVAAEAGSSYTIEMISAQ